MWTYGRTDTGKIMFPHTIYRSDEGALNQDAQSTTIFSLNIIVIFKFIKKHFEIIILFFCIEQDIKASIIVIL